MKDDSRTKFVIASSNPGKVRELRDILTSLDFIVITRQELGVDIDVEETGGTFTENAMLKAKAICDATGLPSIADDSGLVIDALGGAPGLYTSSFGGEGLDDRARCQYLLSVMDGREQRSAMFVSAIVCVFPDGTSIAAQGECAGSITMEQLGSGGFGYDPVFIAEGMDVTMAELPSVLKHDISHRGKALKQFAKLLEVES